MTGPHTRGIDVNPDILMGKPMIAGTRIPVYLILNLFASGYDEERIIEAYPVLTRDDVRAALSYAKKHMRYEEIHRFASTETPA